MAAADIAQAPPVANSAGTGSVGMGLYMRVAWRNLWRNGRRTWLTAGGIAFSVFLCVAFMSFQLGSYDGMIDTATGMMSGHMQVQHEDYLDDPKVANRIVAGSDLLRQLEDSPDIVAAAARVEGFALVSVGERSFGGLVMGVDPVREPKVSALSGQIVEGEYLPRADSAYVGKALGTNLGLKIGDEIFVLGSALEGGVAAAVFNVDGFFDTGQVELDRSILQVPLSAVQSAFGLGDSVHRIVLLGKNANDATAIAQALAPTLPEEVRVLDWDKLLPELRQMIQMDAVTSVIIYVLLLAIVTLSVANSFTMTVFERTREFGMLIAIGMKPGGIVAMIVIEALCMWVVGTAIGAAISYALMIGLGAVGVPIAGLEEMAGQFMMPERIHPEVSFLTLGTAPLVLLAGTLVAGLIPALRVRRLKPVEALREEE